MTTDVNTSNDPYIIVSSDTHAGLQCEDYRPYLESSLHGEFDDFLAELGYRHWNETDNPAYKLFLG